MTVESIKAALIERAETLRQRIGPAPKKPCPYAMAPVEYHTMMLKYEGHIRERKRLQTQISTLLGASDMLED